jgi:hypothetical protein
MTDTEILMDKVRIYELCARYTLALDRHDIEGWTRCFTEDGVFGFGTRGIRGRDKINEYGNVHKRLASRHLTTSLLYDVDPSGDYARGQSTTVMTLATRRGYRIGFLGRYDDELRKIGGEWRFARRWVTADTLPTDPEFDVLAADPEIAELIQPLLDAYERLGEPE